MMDGQVAAIRAALDAAGFDPGGHPGLRRQVRLRLLRPVPRGGRVGHRQFGDRRGYQMDPANAREALREVALDIERGRGHRDGEAGAALPGHHPPGARAGSTCPLAAYNVSGEYAMVKAAAAAGLARRASGSILEMLTAIKRAGADIILTYFAKDAARWLRE